MTPVERMVVRVVVVLGLAHLVAGDSAGQDRVRHLYALLVIDTNTRLEGLEMDERNLSACLESQLPGGSVSIRTVKGDAVNGQTIDREINALAGRLDTRSDTFLLYYGGHGATINGEHSLTLNNGETIPRGQLRRKLLSLNTHLAVLLSDCCANAITLPPSKTMPMPQAPGRMAPPVRFLEHLLFGHSGLVDLNSSSFDESSWGTETGGLFTSAFARLAYPYNLERLDRNPRDGFVAWDEFFPAVRGATIQGYQSYRLSLLREVEVPADVRNSLRIQADQRPHAFSLARRDRGAGIGERFDPGLGVYYELVSIIGATLTRDAPAGSVAAQRPLERGDMIVLLDNMPIYGIDDLRNHIGTTPSVFVNIRTGLAESFAFQLPNQLLPAAVDGFVPNFGVSVETVPLLGARLTRDAPPGSAAAQRPLERGDLIVLLDGTPIRTPQDVAAHQGITPAVFVNIRTGLAESFTFNLPSR